MALSRIEDAFQEMLGLIGYLGDYASNDWSDRALHTVAKNAYRLREQGEPGARVRILRGPFTGHLAIFADMRPRERVEILLQLLGGEQRVTLAKKDIEVVR